MLGCARQRNNLIPTRAESRKATVAKMPIPLGEQFGQSDADTFRKLAYDLARLSKNADTVYRRGARRTFAQPAYADLRYARERMRGIITDLVESFLRVNELVEQREEQHVQQRAARSTGAGAD